VGVLDTPAARKVHAVATPLLGGAAVYAAFAAAVLFNFNFSGAAQGRGPGGPIIVGVGVLDDLFDVAGALEARGPDRGGGGGDGVWRRARHGPRPPAGSQAANVLLTLLWFVTVTNALQFLDGMDGLAAGLGAVAALFFSLAALQTNQPYLMFLAARCGRVPRVPALQLPLRASGHDLPRRRRASFIGFTLAGLAVMGEWAENDLIGLLTPVLILAVPLFDIAFVGTVRVATGKVHSFASGSPTRARTTSITASRPSA